VSLNEFAMEDSPLTCASPIRYQRLAFSSPDSISIEDPHNIDTSGQSTELTSLELWRQIEAASIGLRDLGLKAGDRVALFAESSRRWIVADQAIMLSGGVDCVRGSTASIDELSAILMQSKCSGLIVQDLDCLKRLAQSITSRNMDIKFIIVLWKGEGDLAGTVDLAPGISILSFAELLGRCTLPLPPLDPPISRQSLATLVFTSGTGGKPKAVALTHGNLLYQIENLDYFLPVSKGQTSLSLLPPWHIYERSTSYYIASRGAKLVYSNVKRFAADLQRVRPDFLVCVPLVLESLYSKVMLKIKASSFISRTIALWLIAVSISYIKAVRITQGVSLNQVTSLKSKRFFIRFMAGIKAWMIALITKPLMLLARVLVFSKIREAVGVKGHVVCGGGSLSPQLDDFFEAISLPVLNGYGLTETSPVVCCRRSVHNVRGTIGLPTPGTEIKIIDTLNHEEVEAGQQGLIMVRGPGVFSCYDSDAEATAGAFWLTSGWFDTGDLGWKVGKEWRHMEGSLVISGRAKDTIVLSNGKNVEPEVIESALANSSMIKSTIVVGSDKRELGALVIPEPDALEVWRQEGKLEASEGRKEIQTIVLKEVQALNRGRSDFKPHEQIIHIVMVLDGRSLSIENGTLTRTMKLRRAEARKYFSREFEDLNQALR
jgi:long-chain acyl-CoA synthetase